MGGVLERLADTIGGWDPSRAGDRSACAEGLQGMARNMEAAIAVWGECAREAGPVKNHYTAIIALGPERARELHRLHLEQRRLAQAVSAASGVALGDAMGIEDDVDIVQPYAQFDPGESVEARAGKAVATLEARRAAIEQAIARL